MKIVANFRGHWLPFSLSYKDHKPILELEIINSDEYTTFTRMKNIINKHYIISSTSFLMRKSKIGNWLAARNKFSSRNGSYPLLYMFTKRFYFNLYITYIIYIREFDP